MQRHHTGSGRRRVIPDDWAAHHRVAIEGSLRGAVALRKPGNTQTWSDAEQAMVATPLTPYASDVRARVQALSGQARVIQLADDREVIADYLVVVDADRAVAGGDLVDVIASDDPDLTGRTLRVEQVVRGTERFERDLFCTLDD